MSVETLYRRLHENAGPEALAAAREIGARGEVVVVSACLCGIPCRFDARDRRADAVPARTAGAAILPICPEVLGGMGVPRPPVRFGADGRVRDEGGRDHTAALDAGAARALALCEAAGAQRAILQERSPSCGVRQVHGPAGVQPGRGLFARALAAAGLALSTEEEGA